MHGLHSRTRKQGDLCTYVWRWQIQKNETLTGSKKIGTRFERQTMRMIRRTVFSCFQCTRTIFLWKFLFPFILLASFAFILSKLFPSVSWFVHSASLYYISFTFSVSRYIFSFSLSLAISIQFSLSNTSTLSIFSGFFSSRLIHVSFKSSIPLMMLSFKCGLLGTSKIYSSFQSSANAGARDTNC